LRELKEICPPHPFFFSVNLPPKPPPTYSVCMSLHWAYEKEERKSHSSLLDFFPSLFFSPGIDFFSLMVGGPKWGRKYTDGGWLHFLFSPPPPLIFFFLLWARAATTKREGKRWGRTFFFTFLWFDHLKVRKGNHHGACFGLFFSPGVWFFWYVREARFSSFSGALFSFSPLLLLELEGERRR